MRSRIFLEKVRSRIFLKIYEVWTTAMNYVECPVFGWDRCSFFWKASHSWWNKYICVQWCSLEIPNRQMIKPVLNTADPQKVLKIAEVSSKSRMPMGDKHIREDNAIAWHSTFVISNQIWKFLTDRCYGLHWTLLTHKKYLKFNWGFEQQQNADWDKHIWEDNAISCTPFISSGILSEKRTQQKPIS